MKEKTASLVKCIVIPLAVGGLSALLTRNAMEMFGALNQPTWAPPAWLFPVVWTILYILMGIASWLVLYSGEDREAIDSAWTIYGVQLAVNFFWSIIFFNLRQYLAAFWWLILLDILILIMIFTFSKLSKLAAYLLIPYLVWVTFAGGLNWAIYLLNR